MATQALESTDIVLDVICGVGFVANLLVMAVFAAKKKLRVKYYGLVFNLVITDLALYTVNALYQLKRHPATHVLRYICLFTESLNILAVAVNRLVALTVKPPGRYEKIVTRGRLVAVCVLMWVASAAINVPFRFAVASNVAKLVMPIIRITVLAFTGVVYGVVFRKIARYKAPLASSPGIDKDDEQTGRRLKQTRHLMITFTIIFILCCVSWLPFIIANLLIVFNSGQSLHDHQLAFLVYLNSSLIFLLANSAINPFIYWWRIHDFRVSLYDLVCVRRRRRQKANVKSVDMETTVDSVL